MKPKEKADELVHNFRMLLMNEDTDCGEEILVSILSEKCALIAVNLIIKLEYDKEYWKEVKQEIEKL